jgi:mono/diheme cytochrome c family protein
MRRAAAAFGEEDEMRSPGSFSLGLPFLFALTAPAFAEDAAKGAELAAEHCALCHDVTAEGAAKLYPPSFASIAGFRTPEQIYARIVFPAMHSGMPEVAFYLLGKDEIRSIVAYIVSLEK